MESTDAYSWMQLLILGGLAGAMGQAIRLIVGIKKLNDAASAASTDLSDLIVPSRLIVSLLIGFIAGGLASVSVIKDMHHIVSEQIFALAAAGYAGADFIEGFMSRVTPAPGAGAGQAAIGTDTGQPAVESGTNADGSVG